MKKLFLVIFLIILTCIPVLAETKSTKTDTPSLEKNLYKLAGNYHNIYYLNILNNKYTCCNNNCYDFDSFHYNKLIKTYSIDMIADLMNWNLHEEYPSPNNDGYISHLLFNVKMHNDKLVVKYKRFVTGNVIVDYKNDKAYSARYNILAIHKGKPVVITNITEFETTFYEWIDINALKKLLKTW